MVRESKTESVKKTNETANFQIALSNIYLCLMPRNVLSFERPFRSRSGKHRCVYEMSRGSTWPWQSPRTTASVALWDEYRWTRVPPSFAKAIVLLVLRHQTHLLQWVLPGALSRAANAQRTANPRRSHAGRSGLPEEALYFRECDASSSRWPYRRAIIRMQA